MLVAAVTSSDLTAGLGRRAVLTGEQISILGMADDKAYDLALRAGFTTPVVTRVLRTSRVIARAAPISADRPKARAWQPPHGTAAKLGVTRRWTRAGEGCRQAESVGRGRNQECRCRRYSRPAWFKSG